MARLNVNNYLRVGGMILFDTKDAGIGGFAVGDRNSKKLRELAESLDIPPLEPVPPGHVLSRTYYVLDEFPGRYNGAIWVEATQKKSNEVGFRAAELSNDGVTSGCNWR